MLSANYSNSDSFYVDCAHCADSFIQSIDPKVSELISNFMEWVNMNSHEPLRSREEYIIELLTIGLFWDRYSGASVKSSIASLILLRTLYTIRRNLPHSKPFLDPVRGVLSDRFLVKSINRFQNPAQPTTFGWRRWLFWLEASGEFHDETERIRNWFKWSTRETTNKAELTTIAHALFRNFKAVSANKLGMFTQGVTHFKEQHLVKYRNREDQLFCGKSEPEYHLNMLAMELINRAFRSAFLKTNRRIVLLPSCMRGANESSCKAVVNGTDIRCVACCNECRIGKIQVEGQHAGFEVAIVPHSGGFSKWLKRFAFSDEYGVVAVACVLNIAVGGYEMRRLGIPSQCVLLDYCGCKKHWDSQGCATDLNIRQLRTVIGL